MIKTMSHMPKGYVCPFCQVTSGLDVPDKGTKQDDVIFQNDYVTAFIASKWWPNNKGPIPATLSIKSILNRSTRNDWLTL
ncbi:hypothetical protein JOC34_003428 [Virgibacillus halotolerans]|uniref:hypothetical protein n=1 Tax=Virgibacillus halotolerans TaxID=1071053 RepID=UPI00195FD156|nr:hypothetical protein [Virgibacillus halotolerans]MBM7601007.1 hypothetical protein [Virgibacillus halotolerans]